MAVRDGEVVPRRELAEFRGKDVKDDSPVRLRVFRALYLPGTDSLAAESEEANHERLTKFLSGKRLRHIDLTPRKLAHSEAALEDALRWASGEAGSEGAMMKRASSTYSLGGQNDLWAKVKLVREVRALVYDRQGVSGSPGVWNYLCAAGPIPASEKDEWKETVEYAGKLWAPLGKTFNTSVDAKPGDVLRVEVTELLIDLRPGKRVAHWFTPSVIEKDSGAPSSLEALRRLAQTGEVRKVWDRDIPILKTAEERFVLGVVLEPNDGKGGAPLDPDSQTDVYSTATIRAAAHKFMEDYRNLGLMHREFVNGAAKILESYLAPCDFDLAGYPVRAGTWLLAVRIVDDSLWQSIKDGELTGFSIGGSAIRRPRAA